MKTCIIIPARLASARLKKKMLANIHGLPMVIHTMKRGLDANVGPVYIATPDDEIESTVIDYCGSPLKVIDGDTGTDRVYNAVKQYDLDFDIIVNLQGDCPVIDPKTIRECVVGLVTNPGFDISTPVAPIKKEDIDRPSVVKSYVAEDGELLDCNRYHERDETPWHHVGLYVYRKKSLERFCNLRQSKRELDQSLEQLRALDNGMKMLAVKVDSHTISVDTQEDLDRARDFLKNE